MVSLVGSGVFERFPDLQIVMEEGGISWVPPLMWRLDRSWESMRSDGAALTTRPSDTVRGHFWLTTQPLDEPEKDVYLAQMFAHLDMDDRVLFASDYPHWDFDDLNRVLPAAVIGRERRERILSTNAEKAFRFESIPRG